MGWRWIFWFLTIITTVCLLLVIAILPETCKNIVGNGSLPPPVRIRLPIPFRSNFMRPWRNQNTDARITRRQRFPNPLKSLKVLLRKDNAVVIFSCGFMYAVYACNIASLSTLCIEIYHLNEWQAGIIYLPFGVGGMVSTLFSGWLLDTAYRKARTKCGLPTDKVRGDDLKDFAIERARLEVMWLPMIVTGICTVGYGWSLQNEVVRMLRSPFLPLFNGVNPASCGSSITAVHHWFSATNKFQRE